MNYSELLTPTNIATIVAFGTIAVFLQWVFQKLLRAIFDFIDEEDKNNKVAQSTTKKIRFALKLIALLINLVLFVYVIYTVVLTPGKDLPPWFLIVLTRYGRIILLAVAIFLIYKVGITVIRKGIHALLFKVGLPDFNIDRAELREQTLTQILSYLMLVILSVFFLYEVLIALGFDLKAILATAGFAGLGFGFAAQNLIRDYINGFFIILEDIFAVGDVISVNGNGGFVEKITLRTTHLRNTFGTLINIPNSEMTVVQNLTKDWSRVDFTIGVDYATDIPKSLKILWEELEELKKEMPDDILEEKGKKPDVLALDSFGNSSLNLRIWFKTKPIRQWAVQRAYNERILRRFNSERIVIPFPQTTVSTRDETNVQLAQFMKKG